MGGGGGGGGAGEWVISIKKDPDRKSNRTRQKNKRAGQKSGISNDMMRLKTGRKTLDIMAFLKHLCRAKQWHLHQVLVQSKTMTPPSSACAEQNNDTSIKCLCRTKQWHLPQVLVQNKTMTLPSSACAEQNNDTSLKCLCRTKQWHLPQVLVQNKTMTPPSSACAEQNNDTSLGGLCRTKTMKKNTG